MKKNKQILKIISFIIAACLIGAILFVTNAFVGNPVSSAFAKKTINEYVAEKYAHLNLDVGKVSYNFKDSNYMARAKSKTSIDTHFNIYYRNGEIKWDEYESSVLGKYNTLSRLETEYSELAIQILSKIPGLENNRAMVLIEKWEYEQTNGDIKLDMKFDKSLPIDMKVIIRTDLKDISLKNIADILESSHRILLDHGCRFTSYDIFSESDSDGTLVMVNDVTPEDIESGQLDKLLEDALNYEEEELDKVAEKDNKEPDYNQKINVFIKHNTK